MPVSDNVVLCFNTILNWILMVIELRVLPLQDIVPSYFYILFPPTHSSSAECKAVFRIRTFFPDPDRTSFPESGSAKNRDPI